MGFSNGTQAIKSSKALGALSFFPVHGATFGSISFDDEAEFDKLDKVD